MELLFILGAIIGVRYLWKYLYKLEEEDKRRESEQIEMKKMSQPDYIVKSQCNNNNTKAIATRDVNDIVEVYRRPAIKPGTQAEYPVPYKAPEKPVPQEPKVTIIVGKPPESLSSITPYKPNKLIEPVIEKTREQYQLPPGSVEMPPEETAVIVAAILYFINDDDKIGITKLESYIIMLDYMCLKETGQRLLHYRLTYGDYGYYIQNFRAFLDFIEEKKILTKRRKYYDRRKYRMDFTAHYDVPEEIFPEKLLTWLEVISRTWRDAGARHTKRDIFKQLSPEALEKFTSVHMFEN